MKQVLGLNWFTAALIVILAYFGYIGWQQQINISRIGTEKADVNAKYQEVLKENEALKAEKEKLFEPENLERIAREELGLVKPGEMPYIPSIKK